MSRCAIGKALLNDCVTTMADWIREEYGPKGARGNTLYDLIQTNSAFDTITSPKGDLEHMRYFTEDVPVGLVCHITIK